MPRDVSSTWDVVLQVLSHCPNYVDRYLCLDYSVTSQHMGYGSASFDVAGDARSVPLQAGYVDAMLLLDILEHVFEISAILANAARLLKPGGSLLLTTPFIYPVHGKPYDFHRFSYFALEKHLEKHHLRILERVVLGCYGTVLVVLLNQFLDCAVWGCTDLLKIAVLPLRPLLRGVFALFNYTGFILDLLTKKQPTCIYLENAVVCERVPARKS